MKIEATKQAKAAKARAMKKVTDAREKVFMRTLQSMNLSEIIEYQSLVLNNLHEDLKPIIEVLGMSENIKELIARSIQLEISNRVLK